MDYRKHFYIKVFVHPIRYKKDILKYLKEMKSEWDASRA